VVRGTISLPIRRVPAGAILQIFLFDLTNRAAPQIVVDQAINNPGTNRIAYVLRFDPRFVDPSHTYGVQARVIYGSPPVVLFTSRPRTVYVLTRGNPTQADLTLRRARAL